MFPSISVNAVFAALPLAATADEIQPWMIIAIAVGALLAFLLIIFAARKARGPKGEDLRETMQAAKNEAANASNAALSGLPTIALDDDGKNAQTPSGGAAGSGKGKHAK